MKQKPKLELEWELLVTHAQNGFALSYIRELEDYVYRIERELVTAGNLDDDEDVLVHMLNAVLYHFDPNAKIEIRREREVKKKLKTIR